MKIRKKIIAGNWKMNKTPDEAEVLAKGVVEAVAGMGGVDVVVCPPFTALERTAKALKGSDVGLGAQNMHWEPDGAYTGEISAGMLRDLYCHYVILGHSERRTYFGETDAIVNHKVKAALAANLLPIVCVGESLEEREADRTEEVIQNQIEGSLSGLAEELKQVIVAYEPIWAIGTGRTATPQMAQDVHAFIRRVLTGLSDAETAETVRIQYGGSMKPGNAEELLSQPDIDGGLIGGAALDARSFVEIVRHGV